MKFVVLTFLITFIQAGPTILKDKTEESNVILSLEGILRGIDSDIHLEDFKDCIGDVFIISKDLWNAVIDLKSGTTGGVVSGLQEIAAAVYEMPVAISACTSSPSTVAKLELAIEAFTDPWKFYFEVSRHLIINGVEIYDDINSSITEWDTGDYYTFGLYLGKAMSKMAFGEPRPFINN